MSGASDDPMPGHNVPGVCPECGDVLSGRKHTVIFWTPDEDNDELARAFKILNQMDLEYEIVAIEEWEPDA